jgi:MFS family permease
MTSAGIAVNILPDQLLAFFGERAIMMSTAVDCFTATLSLLCAPMIGKFSDRYGRRVSLALSLAALSLPYIPLAISNNLVYHMALRPFTGVLFEYRHFRCSYCLTIHSCSMLDLAKWRSTNKTVG